MRLPSLHVERPHFVQVTVSEKVHESVENATVLALCAAILIFRPVDVARYMMRELQPFRPARKLLALEYLSLALSGDLVGQPSIPGASCRAVCSTIMLEAKPPRVRTSPATAILLARATSIQLHGRGLCVWQRTDGERTC